MLNKIIAWSLAHRSVVVALAAIILIYGGTVAHGLPVDVLPDLNRPVVEQVGQDAPQLLAVAAHVGQARRDGST